ncbi:MAG: hypothetical protein ACOY31_12335 [Bacillota bacterium]
MFEMKAFFHLVENEENQGLYITNNPRIRKVLGEWGVDYRGWNLEDGCPADEKKAPTLRIETERAAVPEEEENTVQPPGENSERIMEIKDYLVRSDYTEFDDWGKFLRLEKFNRFPGRMMVVLIIFLIIWTVWTMLSTR